MLIGVYNLVCKQFWPKKMHLFHNYLESIFKRTFQEAWCGELKKKYTHRSSSFINAKNNSLHNLKQEAINNLKYERIFKFLKNKISYLIQSVLSYHKQLLLTRLFWDKIKVHGIYMNPNHH